MTAEEEVAELLEKYQLSQIAKVQQREEQPKAVKRRKPISKEPNGAHSKGEGRHSARNEAKLARVIYRALSVK
jgi:hypothetical protein